jgi:hypothetical protein
MLPSLSGYFMAKMIVVGCCMSGGVPVLAYRCAPTPVLSESAM